MYRRTLLALCGLVAAPIFGQHCSQALAAHAEADGDYHIQIQLDATQPDDEVGRSLLTARNRKVQKSCLVVEVICKAAVTQEDAIEACRGAKKVRVPAKGSHVAVVGPMCEKTCRAVMDGWRFTVTSITVVP